MRFKITRYPYEDGDYITSHLYSKDGDIELHISNFSYGTVIVSATRYGINCTMASIHLRNPSRTDIRRAIAYVMSAIKEPFVQGETNEN